MKLLRVIGVLLLLGLVALGAGVFYFDSLARTAIERGATHALGVDTRVGSVSLGLLRGSFRLGGLRVANPPGFEAGAFLSLADGRLDVSPASLRQDTVVVPLLSLEGIRLNLERRQGRNNYQAILDNLKRFESGEPDPPGAAPGGGKKFVVKQIVIRDVAVEVDMIEAIGEAGRVSVAIPEIRLRDIGSGGGGGVALAELTDVVVKAILRALSQHGAELPTVLARQLGAGLGRLEGVAVDVVGAVGKGMGDRAAEQLRELGAGGQKLVGEKAGRALEGLGGLLGGKREPPEERP